MTEYYVETFALLRTCSMHIPRSFQFSYLCNAHLYADWLSIVSTLKHISSPTIKNGSVLMKA